MRKKCPWSVFSRIWTEYGEIRNISPFSVRMRENTHQKNSKYGNFSRSVKVLHMFKANWRRYYAYIRHVFKR